MSGRITANMILRPSGLLEQALLAQAEQKCPRELSEKRGGSPGNFFNVLLEHAGRFLQPGQGGELASDRLFLSLLAPACVQYIHSLTHTHSHIP